jgi:hypothetical protein
MGAFLLHHAGVQLYLLFVGALSIAFFCACPRRPETGPRLGRRQDADRSWRLPQQPVAEKSTDTKYEGDS